MTLISFNVAIDFKLQECALGIISTCNSDIHITVIGSYSYIINAIKKFIVILEIYNNFIKLLWLSRDNKVELDCLW